MIGVQKTISAFNLLPHVEQLAVGLGVLALAFGIGEFHGRWAKAKECEGMGATEKRQLAGNLTPEEKNITAPDLASGKVGTELLDPKAMIAALTGINADQAKVIEDLRREHRLDVSQISQLRAFVDAHRTDASAGIAAGGAGAGSECGACAGAVRFGSPPYATCSWPDYAALKAGHGAGALDLKLGVRVDQVTLRQRPKDGTLEAVIGKIYLQDQAGGTIGEAQLREDSRVFTAPAGRGDLDRRHIYGYGVLDPLRGCSGLLTQKGVRPWIWGGGGCRDWRTGKIDPQVMGIIQLR